MVSHRVAGAPLDFAALRTELEVPGDFDAGVLADAEQAARSVRLPDDDATDIPFVTIDPAGSRDLDQAVHIARADDHFDVSYAIADVATFVAAGSPLDGAARARGETLYFPDARVPLHPTVLSEGAASLLPGQIRPAVLWRIRLDATGKVVDVQVGRARVRSRRQLDYETTQRELDGGRADDAIALLPHVGKLRIALARSRHAIDLDLPEQQVTKNGDAWTLTSRGPLPVEKYNAEISLLTGMCAARLMLDGGIGILRTVPDPDPGAIARLRRVAHALNVPWHRHASPGDVLATLDRGNPHQVAVIEHAAMLLRGSAYVPFSGTAPEHGGHAGVGAPYAHVTAPLRRLVDRFGTEICLALYEHRAVPVWVTDAFPTLPDQMARADHLAHAVDRAVVDATEAWLLRDRVGSLFHAIVIDADDRAGTVLLDRPAVRARCDGAGLPVGEAITVRLVEADVATRTVRFDRD
jgi:exoribonuclease R